MKITSLHRASFNDPTILKNYIDNQIKDAKSLQIRDQRYKGTKDRRVVSNQQSYRKILISKPGMFMIALQANYTVRLEIFNYLLV